MLRRQKSFVYADKQILSLEGFRLYEFLAQQTRNTPLLLHEKKVSATFFQKKENKRKKEKVEILI